VLGAPVVVVNLIQGQNGIMTAGLLVAAMVARQRGQVWLAALTLGLLVIKPHLALLVPVALLAARDYRLFGRVALVALGSCLLTGLVLGFDAWEAFILHLPDAKSIALRELELLAQNPSAYAAMTLLGAPEMLAWMAQGLSAGLAVVFIWRLWASNQEGDLRLAGLMAASLLVSPYVFRYDMTFTLAATLLLLRIARRDGYLSGEKLVLATLWIMPAIFPVIADATRVQLGFPVLFLALWAVARRAKAKEFSEPNARGRVSHP
ncbi:MAG: glycosyltransferase family 87 protein, partial [Deltaproteobacteria bacterium]